MRTLWRALMAKSACCLVSYVTKQHPVGQFITQIPQSYLHTSVCIREFITYDFNLLHYSILLHNGANAIFLHCLWYLSNKKLHHAAFLVDIKWINGLNSVVEDETYSLKKFSGLNSLTVLHSLCLALARVRLRSCPTLKVFIRPNVITPLIGLLKSTPRFFLVSLHPLLHPNIVQDPLPCSHCNVLCLQQPHPPI